MRQNCCPKGVLRFVHDDCFSAIEQILQRRVEVYVQAIAVYDEAIGRHVLVDH